MIPIGDYCSGLLTALNFFFFGGLLVIAILIITIIDVIKSKKTKKRFDVIPITLTLIIGLSFFIIIKQEEPKFWTERTLIGWIEVESTPKSGRLLLYQDGTFAATLHSADYSCTFQGDYELIDDQLKLNRIDVSEITNNVFTTAYLIDNLNKTLIPVDEDFGKIEIRE